MDVGGGPANIGWGKPHSRRARAALAVESGKSYCLLMSAADTVLKPDFAARRKHFIFTDEHERCASRSAASSIKELAPHAEEWEETTFPDSVFPRMGELGFLGLDKPEEYGGQGGDYYSQPRAGRGDRPRRSPAAWRWASPCRPTWRCRRSSRSGPRSRSSEWLVPGDRGREDPLPRDHRARRRLRRGRDQDARRARRRRVRHQRLEDLHHQRPPRAT